MLSVCWPNITKLVYVGQIFETCVGRCRKTTLLSVTTKHETNIEIGILKEHLKTTLIKHSK